MKHSLIYFLPAMLILLSGSCLYGQDMRALQIQAQQVRQKLAEQAAAEREAARQETIRIRAQILGDKAALDQSIARLQAQNRQLQHTLAALEAEIGALEEKEKTLTQQLAASDSMVREMVGVFRLNAKDLGDLVTENLQTALGAQAVDFLRNMAGQADFKNRSAVTCRDGPKQLCWMSRAAPRCVN